MSKVLSFLDCGCAIMDNGSRSWCPSCSSPIPSPGPVPFLRQLSICGDCWHGGNGEYCKECLSCVHECICVKKCGRCGGSGKVALPTPARFGTDFNVCPVCDGKGWFK